jgi:hypothetical protein
MNMRFAYIFLSQRKCLTASPYIALFEEINFSFLGNKDPDSNVELPVPD